MKRLIVVAGVEVQAHDAAEVDEPVGGLVVADGQQVAEILWGEAVRVDVRVPKETKKTFF